MVKNFDDLVMLELATVAPCDAERLRANLARFELNREILIGLKDDDSDIDVSIGGWPTVTLSRYA